MLTAARPRKVSAIKQKQRKKRGTRAQTLFYADWARQTEQEQFFSYPIPSVKTEDPEDPVLFTQNMAVDLDVSGYIICYMMNQLKVLLTFLFAL